jgi:hypothetical protein
VPPLPFRVQCLNHRLGLDATGYKRACEKALGYRNDDHDSQHQVDEPALVAESLWKMSATGGTDVPISSGEEDCSLVQQIKIEGVTCSPTTRDSRAGSRRSHTPPESHNRPRPPLGEITNSSPSPSSPRKGALPMNQTARRSPKHDIKLSRSTSLSRAGVTHMRLSDRRCSDFEATVGVQNLLLPRRSNILLPGRSRRPSEILAGKRLYTSLDQMLDAAGWSVESRRPGQVFQGGGILVNGDDVKQITRFRSILAGRRPRDGCGAPISLIDIACLYPSERDLRVQSCMLIQPNCIA